MFFLLTHLIETLELILISHSSQLESESCSINFLYLYLLKLLILINLLQFVFFLVVYSHDFVTFIIATLKSLVTQN